MPEVQFWRPLSEKAEIIVASVGDLGRAADLVAAAFPAMARNIRREVVRQFAARMLRDCATEDDTRAALRQRFGVSRRTSYRMVAQARALNRGAVPAWELDDDEE